MICTSNYSVLYYKYILKGKAAVKTFNIRRKTMQTVRTLCSLLYIRNPPVKQI